MRRGRRGLHFGVHGTGARRWAALSVTAVLLGGLAAGAAAGAPRLDDPGARPGIHTHSAADGEQDVNVCSDAVPAGEAHCLAHVRVDAAARTRVPTRPGALGGSNAPVQPGAVGGSNATLGNAGAYDPSWLQSAYNLPSAAGGAGKGQTVAIVDAYDDPTAAADLNAYRAFFGLPACTTGCFTKVDENGGTAYPQANAGWSQEISLDLDMVSAVCANCKIVLVEAASAYMADLGTAVNTAVRLGANVVSNSYGSSEYSTEIADTTQYFTHPGVAIVASSGDAGYGVEFPAASNTVTAVGGTSLLQSTDTGTRNATETAWSGAGSGCSAFETKPAWQVTAGCSNRTVADVSAIADPNTGVWVYDTYGTAGSWLIFGGTSVAAPIVGSVYALAGNGASGNTLAQYPYLRPGPLNDVMSGANGSCSPSLLCTAGPGYDGPTGLGTPNGTTAFTPLAVGPTPPTQPTSPSATPGNATVTLAWSAPASAGTAPVTSYNVYRGTSSGTETLVKAVTSPGYIDGSLTNGKSYFYYVTAVSSAGEGARSVEVSATPQAPTAPAAPVTLVATPGAASVTLAWSASAGSSVTYSVYRATTSGAELAGAAVVSGLTSTGWVDGGLTNGATYYYIVEATSAGLTSGPSPEASATPSATAAVPGQPTLGAARSTTRGVALSWSAPVNNGAAITSYILYRSRTSGQESTYVTVSCTSTTCAYNDSNARSGRTYYYQLAAVNAVGTSPRSAQASATAS